MHHLRKTHKRYRSYPKPDGCPFCNPAIEEEIIHMGKHAYVVPNRTFYDIWELRKVVDHVLVVPKRHVASFAELPAADLKEIIDLIADYEGKGYDVYARGGNNPMRSITGHQHTHLFKTEGKRGRLLFYLRKPYLVIRL